MGEAMGGSDGGKRWGSNGGSDGGSDGGSNGGSDGESDVGSNGGSDAVVWGSDLLWGASLPPTKNGGSDGSLYHKPHLSWAGVCILPNLPKPIIFLFCIIVYSFISHDHGPRRGRRK